MPENKKHFKKKKKKRPVTRTQEPAEVLHESIWVMDTIRELFLSRSHLNTRVIEKKLLFDISMRGIPTPMPPYLT